VPPLVESVGDTKEEGRADTMSNHHEVGTKVAEFRAYDDAHGDHAYVHHGREGDEPFRISLPRANQPTSDATEQGDGEVEAQQRVEEKGAKHEKTIRAQLEEDAG